MAVVLATPPAPTNTKQMPTATTTIAHSCPKCGTSLEEVAEDTQRQIRELEAQVEMLKEKATAAGMSTLLTRHSHARVQYSEVEKKHRGFSLLTNATVDKCADYEDQIRSIKTFPSNTTESLDPNSMSRRSNEDARPGTANSSAAANKSRFSFLTGRRGSPAQSLSVLQPPPSDTELHEQLEKERALRAKAEDRARTVDLEIEELSVQLFSQANEMVASERRARAKLEERVEMLEKKDRDKMARLERLEKAVSRIDRVKAILATPTVANGRKT
jgi:hypothetical protein